MEKSLKAAALRVLADKLDFEYAKTIVPSITKQDWIALLKEAAEFFEPAESVPVEPINTNTPADVSMRPVLFTDGASRGNPGHAAAGVIIYLGSKVFADISEYLGMLTNNQAEYKALISGLKKVIELGFKEVSIRSDSQLMVRQIEGLYKVKDNKLKPLYSEVMKLLKNFTAFDIEHIERGRNKEADALANVALDALK
jgi:ribonuclease HI